MNASGAADPILDVSILRDAADHLDTYGWVPDWGTYGPGTHQPTCAHGAVLSVCGVHPGDAYLWRPIMRLRGLTEVAQDEHTKRWATHRLRTYTEPTVNEMTEAYGPQWAAIRDLVRRS